ncbi:MAG: exo-alpha-sialidase [Verrucomicrobia bacterium]|nr:exo-alpha-sialidase [Verrucomicrobiota bacterium]
MSLVAPSGRIFVFYTYNADDIRELPADNPPYENGTTNRMDSHGYYVYRWSDDHGRTWSSQRVTIPVREFEIDRNNTTGGKIRLFWNVGRPLVSGGSVYLTLHKVGGLGAGWFTQSEGAFVRSDDLLLLDNPAKATWETLPDGEVGLRTPPGGGSVAEEQSLIELSDGSFFVVYRSIDGHPVGCYSRDKGRTWQQPGYLRYADGRHLKHPRAACFAWRLHHGDYVLWFHNHGGVILGGHPDRLDRGYDDRNPVWMCRGREIQTAEGLEVVWDNPEIVLYDDDPCIRMSYPDLKEEAETIYLTETQKAVARVHELGPRLARALRSGSGGFDAGETWREAVLDWRADSAPPRLPPLPAFLARSPESPYGTTDQRAGFTVELEIDCAPFKDSTVLAEAWHPSYGGLRLEWLDEGSLKLTASDGRSEFCWSSDIGLLSDGLRHHVVACVDGGPKILSFLVDGKFCDGGDRRQFGWGRFSTLFRGLPGPLPLSFTNPGLESLRCLRIYPRSLLSAEVEALFLAAGEGPGASSGLSCDFTVKPDLSETSSRSMALGATP